MATYNLTPVWSKIASAGSTVEVQNPLASPVNIMTSAGPPDPTDRGILLVGAGNNDRVLALTLDLWARSATASGNKAAVDASNAVVVVMGGFVLATAGSTSSSGGSSAGTADFSNAANSGLVGAISF